MLFGSLALMAAAMFAGVALYVNAVEQPARLALDDGAMLAQWQPSYKRATVMQVSLIAVSVFMALLAWWRLGGLGWPVGALLMLANLPVTFVLIMPVNRQLMATAPARSGAETRAMIQRWGSLHAIRTALGFAGAFAFAVALGAQ